MQTKGFAKAKPAKVKSPEAGEKLSQMGISGRKIYFYLEQVENSLQQTKFLSIAPCRTLVF